MEKENKIFCADMAEAKELYKAPIIEIIEVIIERGFEISLGAEMDDNDKTW